MTISPLRMFIPVGTRTARSASDQRILLLRYVYNLSVVQCIISLLIVIIITSHTITTFCYTCGDEDSAVGQRPAQVFAQIRLQLISCTMYYSITNCYYFVLWLSLSHVIPLLLVATPVGTRTARSASDQRMFLLRYVYNLSVAQCIISLLIVIILYYDYHYHMSYHYYLLLHLWGRGRRGRPATSAWRRPAPSAGRPEAVDNLRTTVEV